MNLQNVFFKNLARDNTAILQLPAIFDENKKCPAVVTMRPIGSCKEQTAGNVYGKALAEAALWC